MREETVWYGYLEAGQKSTPIVLDRRLHTGHDETIYLFNFERGEILEYQRQIVEQKLQELNPEQAIILKQLKRAYVEARRRFRAKGGRILHLPERNSPERVEGETQRKFLGSAEIIEIEDEEAAENQEWFEEN